MMFTKHPRFTLDSDSSESGLVEIIQNSTNVKLALEEADIAERRLSLERERTYITTKSEQDFMRGQYIYDRDISTRREDEDREHNRKVVSIAARREDEDRDQERKIVNDAAAHSRSMDLSRLKLEANNQNIESELQGYQHNERILKIKQQIL